MVADAMAAAAPIAMQGMATIQGAMPAAAVAFRGLQIGGAGGTVKAAKGPTGSRVDTSGANPVAAAAVLPTARHAQGAGMNALQGVGSIGDKAFNAEFFLPIGGWLGRHTLGRIPYIGNSIKSAIGTIAYAPVHALKNVSNAELWNTPGRLIGEYFHAAHRYSTGDSYLKEGKPRLEGSAFFKEMADKYGGVGKAGETVAEAGKTGLAKWGAKLANASVFRTLMVGGFGVASVYLLLKGLSDNKHDLMDMKEVIHDLTGKMVTTDQLIRKPETLPPMAREIRDNLIAHLMPNTAGTLGGILMNTSLATMGAPAAGAKGLLAGMTGISGMTMIAGMGLQHASGGLAPHEHFLKSYLIVKDLQAEKKPVATQFYADLIASASADARANGGANSRLVKRIAEEFQSVGASAAEVVKEIAAPKKFEARVIRAAEQLEAEDKQRKDTPAHDGPIVAHPGKTVKPEAAPGVKKSTHQEAPATVGAVQHDGRMQEPHALRQAGA